MTPRIQRKVKLTEAQLDIITALIMPSDETIELVQHGEDIHFIPSHDPEQVVVVYPSGHWHPQKRRKPKEKYDTEQYIDDQE